MNVRNDTRAGLPARKRRRPYGLFVVNGALLALLGAVTFGGGGTADAQSRVRGSYMMVGGGVKGSQSHVMYVADTVNRQLIAISYEPSQQQLIGIGYRNLAGDSMSALRGGQNR